MGSLLPIVTELRSPCLLYIDSDWKCEKSDGIWLYCNSHLDGTKNTDFVNI